MKQFANNHFKLLGFLSTGKRKWLLASLSFIVLFLWGCHYKNNVTIGSDSTQQEKDSLTFLSQRYYSINSNFELYADSMQIERLPIKDSFVSLRKGDRIVVAEFNIHPTDTIDSIWVKVAHNQEIQGWIREKELVESFVPTDSISEAIYIFSHTHVSYFLITFAICITLLIARAFYKKQLKVVYFNDIDSVYPILLCVLISFCAVLYESIQLFAPQTWQYFYFNPTLSPFKTPLILSLFLAGLWTSIIVLIAVIDESFKQLRPIPAIFYLLGVLSTCIFCYFFFMYTTNIYIGYLFFFVVAFLFFKRIYTSIQYKYYCGYCGKKIQSKGVCPHCGKMNY